MHRSDSMARSRNIKPSFFTNEILGTLDPMIGLTFIGLWCLADKEGILEDRPLRIRAELFPYRGELDVNGYLTVLEQSGFLTRYSVGGASYIQITNFEKHQHPHHTEQPRGYPKPQASSRKSSLTPLSNGDTPSDSLIPDSLIPDSGFLIPDSGFQIPEQKTSASGFASEPDASIHAGPSDSNGHDLLGDPEPSPASRVISGKQHKPSSKTSRRITFDAVTNRLTGIEEQDRALWRETYPGVDVDAQLKRMTVWLKANPDKRPKSKVESFITKWLGRQQDDISHRAASRASTASRSSVTARMQESIEDARKMIFPEDYRNGKG